MSLLLKKYMLFDQSGSGAALDTTMTIAKFDNMYTYSTTYHTPPAVYQYDGWGFDGGEDYYTTPDAGALADNTYDDGSATERTVAAIYWAQMANGFLFFSLVGTSIPDTADTFVSIEVDGNVYTRASGTYVASKNGGTHWYWYETTRPFPGSGTTNFKVHIV